MKESIQRKKKPTNICVKSFVNVVLRQKNIPGGNLSQLPWPVSFVPMADTVGWTALCQMGGLATVQALHGLIFVWPTSCLPLSLLSASTPRPMGLERRTGREAAQPSWCCIRPAWRMHRGRWGPEALAGWREGVRIQPHHPVFTNTSCLLFYLWIFCTQWGWSDAGS